MVAMEPPPAIEEEFNDWYDSEHVPERLAVDGFESASRFVCTNGWPRYMTIYDLREPGVIDSAGYRGISGNRFSPWTKRMLTRVRGFYRVFGEQIYPGDSTARPAARVLMTRVRGVDASADRQLLDTARHAFENRSGVRRLRVFRAAPAAAAGVPATGAPATGASEWTGTGADILLLAELDGPWEGPTPDAGAFDGLSQGIDLVNEYASYRRL